MKFFSWIFKLVWYV